MSSDNHTDNLGWQENMISIPKGMVTSCQTCLGVIGCASRNKSLIVQYSIVFVGLYMPYLIPYMNDVMQPISLTGGLFISLTPRLHERDLPIYRGYRNNSAIYADLKSPTLFSLREFLDLP